MSAHTVASITAVTELIGHSKHQYNDQTPRPFSLLYSGMNSGQILMGDGVVTSLSPSGIGIRGNRSVKSGMELALFVDLPGLDEPLCIAQSRVSWVAGRRFGVELGTLKLEQPNQLRFFLRDHAIPSDCVN